MLSFHKQLTELHANHNIDTVYNMDQTPVWWNTIGTDVMTLDTKGKKQIHSQVRKGWPKREGDYCFGMQQRRREVVTQFLLKLEEKQS